MLRASSTWLGGRDKVRTVLLTRNLSALATPPLFVVPERRHACPHSRLPRCRLRHLLEEFRRALLHLCRRQIFLTRGDPPGIACRISDCAGSVAPELIVHRHLHLRACAYCAIEECIAVLDEQPQRRG